MAALLPSPSLVHRKQKIEKEGDDSIIAVAFFGVLQPIKNKKRQQQRCCHCLLCCTTSKKQKKKAVVVIVAFFVCCNQKTKKRRWRCRHLLWCAASKKKIRWGGGIREGAYFRSSRSWVPLQASSAQLHSYLPHLLALLLLAFQWFLSPSNGVSTKATRR